MSAPFNHIAGFFRLQMSRGARRDNRLQTQKKNDPPSALKGRSCTEGSRFHAILAQAILAQNHSSRIVSEDRWWRGPCHVGSHWTASASMRRRVFCGIISRGLGGYLAANVQGKLDPHSPGPLALGWGWLLLGSLLGLLFR